MTSCYFLTPLFRQPCKLNHTTPRRSFGWMPKPQPGRTRKTSSREDAESRCSRSAARSPGNPAPSPAGALSCIGCGSCLLRIRARHGNPSVQCFGASDPPEQRSASPGSNFGLIKPQGPLVPASTSSRLEPLLDARFALNSPAATPPLRSDCRRHPIGSLIPT